MIASTWLFPDILSVFGLVVRADLKTSQAVPKRNVFLHMYLSSARSQTLGIELAKQVSLTVPNSSTCVRTQSPLFMQVLKVSTAFNSSIAYSSESRKRTEVHVNEVAFVVHNLISKNHTNMMFL